MSLGSIGLTATNSMGHADSRCPAIREGVAMGDGSASEVVLRGLRDVLDDLKGCTRTSKVSRSCRCGKSARPAWRRSGQHWDRD